MLAEANPPFHFQEQQTDRKMEFAAFEDNGTSLYTDKRTAVSAEKPRHPLNSCDAADLTSARHDQTNQIRQYPSGRSKQRAELLHGQTRVQHHYGSAVR